MVDSNEEGRPWYDTMDGIAEALGSLESFNNLISERHAAGYNRRERLSEYFVFGRYSLDTCGNCGTISGEAPKDEIPGFPDVLPREEFYQYLTRHSTRPQAGCFSIVLGNDIPRHDLVCPVCTKGWAIENCHDAVAVHETKDMILATDEGRTLRELKAGRKARTDAVYFMQSDILIRNDRFIDLSPEYPDATESWQKELVKNQTGWVGAKDGITDDYVIQPGDEGYFNVWTYYHRSCDALRRAVRAEAAFREMFTRAGFAFVVLHHLPNGYCPCNLCAPWFKVETEVGTITIGWRKRVINVDWSETPHKGKDLMSLFASEEVTKGGGFIHAWGIDKAVEYLAKMREALLAPS